MNPKIQQKLARAEEFVECYDRDTIPDREDYAWMCAREQLKRLTSRDNPTLGAKTVVEQITYLVEHPGGPFSWCPH